MTFKARESLSEQIAGHLAAQIIRGDMLAGDRIQELRVAGELEVSRGSVREALLILERRHLIDILPRRGAVVKEMSESQVRGLYELVQVLLGLVIRKAIKNVREDDLDPIIALIHELQVAASDRDLERFFDLSFQFLEHAYPFARNGFVEDVLGDHDDVLALFTNHPKLGDVASINQALCGLWAAGIGFDVPETAPEPIRATIAPAVAPPSAASIRAFRSSRSTSSASSIAISRGAWVTPMRTSTTTNLSPPPLVSPALPECGQDGAMGITTAIPLFPRFTALDGIGPYEVLQRIPDFDVTFIGHERGVVRSDKVVHRVGDALFLVGRSERISLRNLHCHRFSRPAFFRSALPASRRNTIRLRSRQNWSPQYSRPAHAFPRGL